MPNSSTTEADRYYRDRALDFARSMAMPGQTSLDQVLRNAKRIEAYLRGDEETPHVP